jgi:ABC-2 type transport system ATP-binding protein
LVIISTHQVKDIDTIIDKVVIVDKGTLLYDQDTQTINQQWYFDTVPSLNGLTDLQYHEVCPQGHKIIKQVTNGMESPLDLELLFNAVISHSLNH